MCTPVQNTHNNTGKSPFISGNVTPSGVLKYHCRHVFSNTEIGAVSFIDTGNRNNLLETLAMSPIDMQQITDKLTKN